MGDDATQVDKTTKKQRRPYGFQPGISGNPNGRPKGTTNANNISKVVRDFLQTDHPDAEKLSSAAGCKLKTRLDVIMVDLAKDDPKVLLQYGYGKPIETQVLQNPDGTALGTRPLSEVSTDRLRQLAIEAPLPILIPEIIERSGNGNGNSH